MSNVTPIVKELLALKAQMEPLEARFEVAKIAMREVGPNTYIAPGGKVVVSAPVEKKAKGTDIVIDHEKLEEADADLKAQLFALGILKTETIYTRASKSKVEVKLDPASEVQKAA